MAPLNGNSSSNNNNNNNNNNSSSSNNYASLRISRSIVYVLVLMLLTGSALIMVSINQSKVAGMTSPSPSRTASQSVEAKAESAKDEMTAEALLPRILAEASEQENESSHVIQPEEDESEGEGEHEDESESEGEHEDEEEKDDESVRAEEQSQEGERKDEPRIHQQNSESPPAGFRSRSRSPKYRDHRATFPLRSSFRSKKPLDPSSSQNDYNAIIESLMEVNTLTDSKDFDLKLHTRKYAFHTEKFIQKQPIFPMVDFFKTVMPSLLFNVSIAISHKNRLIPHFKRIPDNQRPPLHPMQRDISKDHIPSGHRTRAAPTTCDLTQNECTMPLVTVVTAASGVEELQLITQMLAVWKGYVSITVRVAVHELATLIEWIQAQTKSGAQQKADADPWKYTVVHLLVTSRKETTSLGSSHKDDALLYRTAWEAAPTDIVWPIPIHFLPNPASFHRLQRLLTADVSLFHKLFYTRTAFVFHTMQYHEQPFDVNAAFQDIKADEHGIITPSEKSKLLKSKSFAELHPFSKSHDTEAWVSSQQPYIKANINEADSLFVLLSKRSGNVPKILKRYSTKSISSLTYWFAFLVRADYTFYQDSSVFLVSGHSQAASLWSTNKNLDFDIKKYVIGDSVDNKFYMDSFAPRVPLRMVKDRSAQLSKKFKTCEKVVIPHDAHDLSFLNCRKLYFADLDTVLKSNLYLQKGVWVFTNMAVSKILFYRHDITLTVHMGETKYSALNMIALAWPGPVSCAIYVRSQENAVLDLMNFLQKNEDKFEKWTFHVVLFSTDALEDYPHNRLRNIAMDSIKTDFSFSLDVDFIPNPAMYRDFLDLTQDSHWGSIARHEKTLFITPAFEMDRRYNESDMQMFRRLPKTKVELEGQLRRKKGLYSFHHKIAPNGHRATKFRIWRRLTSNDQIYNTTYQDRFEPYFLVEKGYNRVLPRFEPAFRGFGKNKVSWALELKAAQYQFLVLPLDFVIHLNHPIKRVDNLATTSIMRKFYCNLVAVYGREVPPRLQYQRNYPTEKAAIRLKLALDAERKKELSSCRNQELTMWRGCLEDCFTKCAELYCDLD